MGTVSIGEQAGRALTREEGEVSLRAQLTVALHSFIAKRTAPSTFDPETPSEYINGYRAALDDLEYEIDHTLQSSAWRGGVHLT